MKLINTFSAKSLFILISVLLLLNACVKPNTDALGAFSVAQLMNKTWAAENINQRGIVDNARVTIMFTEAENIAGVSKGRVSGNSGCNNYAAKYEMTGNVLKIIPPMMGTKMMCVPAMTNLENEYMATLTNADKVSFSTTHALIIHSLEGKSIVFRLAN